MGYTVIRAMLTTSRHWFSAPGASVAGLLLLLLCGCSDFRANSAAASLPSAVPAHLYTVAEETARRRVQAVGSLFPLEESTLSAQVEGRVSEVLADVGDKVEEGQPLILLDQQELQFEVRPATRFGATGARSAWILVRTTRRRRIRNSWHRCSAPKPTASTPSRNTNGLRRCSKTT